MPSSIGGWTTRSSEYSSSGPELHTPKSTFALRREEFEHAFFGVLYAMVRYSSTKQEPWTQWANRMKVLALIFDFLQLLSFTVNAVDWGDQLLGRYIAMVLSAFQVPVWVFDNYIIFYWTTTFLLLFSLGDALFVYRYFKNSSFKYLFPLRILKLFVSILVTILYIPVLKIELKVFDCSIIGNHVPCYGLWHGLYMVLSCIMTLVFMIFSVATVLVYYDPDPSSSNILARAHGRIDVVYLGLKTLLACVSIFTYSHPTFILATNGALSTTMVILLTRYLPYYAAFVNNLLSGLHGCNMCFALAFWVTSVFFHASPKSWNIVSVIALACSPIVIVGFSVLTYLRFRRITMHQQKYIVQEIENPKHAQFTTVMDYEIAMRYLRHKSDRANAEKAQALFNQAFDLYPKSTMLHMAYVNFCLSFLDNSRMAYVYIDRMRHLKPPFDIRFYIYRKDSELKQRMQSQSLGSCEPLDLVSYIEFQNNFNSARKFHKKAKMAIRRFWTILLDDDCNLVQLPKAFEQIDTCENKAKQYYVELIAKYPKSVKILRAYAEFLEEIVNDSEAAEQYYYQADMIEEIEVPKSSENVEDIAADRSFISSFTKVGSSDFMVMMDKNSIIKDVNRNCKLFGYFPQDLVNKHIGILIPEPYNSPHDQYVHNHLSTGKTKIIGMGNRRLPVVQKDGSLMSILLSVTKVNVGNNFQFVGLLRKMSEGLIGITTNGTILYSTVTVTSILGWLQSDIKDRGIGMIIENKDELINTEMWKQKEGKLAPVSVGKNSIKFIRKDGSSSHYSVEITFNYVSGLGIYTLWISRNDDETIIDNLENAGEVHSPEWDMALRKRNQVRKTRRANFDLSLKAKKYKRIAVSHLSVKIKWSFVSLFILRITAFILSMTLINRIHGEEVVHRSGKRAGLSQQVCFDSRSLDLYSLNHSATDTFEATQKLLENYVDQFKQTHKELYLNRKIGSKDLREFYSEPSILVQVEGSEIELNLWNLGEMYVSKAQSLATINMESFGLVHVQDDLYAILDNCLVALSAFESAMIMENDQGISYVFLVFLLEVGILGAFFLFLSAIGLFVLSPSFQKIHNERKGALELFLKVPKDTVYLLASAKETNSQGSEVESDEEDQEPAVPEKSKSDMEVDNPPEEEEKEQLGEEGTESIQRKHVRAAKDTIPGLKIKAAGSAKSSARRYAKQNNQSPLLRRLTLRYIVALVIVGIVVMPNMFLAHWVFRTIRSQNTQIAYGNMIFNTNLIKFIASAREYLLTSSQHLIRELEIKLVDPRDTAAELQTSLERLSIVHNDLVFGNSPKHLPGFKFNSKRHKSFLFEDCMLDDKSCSNLTDQLSVWGSHGLNQLLNSWVSEAVTIVNSQIAANFSQPMDELSTKLLQISHPWLKSALGNSMDMYLEEIEATVATQNIVQTIFGLCCAIVFYLIYSYGFGFIIKRIQNETRRTRSMILMIPQHVVDQVEEIQAYLEATQKTGSDEF